MFLSAAASVTAFRIASKSFASIGADSSSVGHICWVGDYEWYQIDNRVYKAHRTDVIDLGTGCRQGRFETGCREVAAHPECFAFLGDRFIDMCQNGNAHLVGV
jgi:hypothetical protein